MLGFLGGPRSRTALTTAVLSIALAGCSWADADDSEAKAGPSDDTSETTSEPGPPTPEEVWAEALRTQGEPIGFRSSTYVDGSSMLSTDGSWTSDPLGWSSTASTTDPETGEQYVIHARSDASGLWMQMDGWPAPRTGCWLELSGEEMLAEQPALAPGKPLQLAILDGFEPSVIKDGGYIVGSARLRDAVRLLGGRLASFLGYENARSIKGEVEMTANLAGPGVDGYRIDGTDILSAATGRRGASQEVQALMDALEYAVELYDYDSAPDEAPKASSILSPAEFESGVGCQPDPG